MNDELGGMWQEALTHKLLQWTAESGTQHKKLKTCSQLQYLIMAQNVAGCFVTRGLRTIERKTWIAALWPAKAPYLS
jgi:hypothetical protein